jgi:hypothetical protein
MSANVTDQFQLVKEIGWKRGLGNLLQGEYSAWFKSSRWWKQILLWFVIVNVMMAMMVIATSPADVWHLRWDVRLARGDGHHAARHDR